MNNDVWVVAASPDGEFAIVALPGSVVKVIFLTWIVNAVGKSVGSFFSFLELVISKKKMVGGNIIWYLSYFNSVVHHIFLLDFMFNFNHWFSVLRHLTS